jgi:hypothetical protein
MAGLRGQAMQAMTSEGSMEWSQKRKRKIAAECMNSAGNCILVILYLLVSLFAIQLHRALCSSEEAASAS